MALIKLQQRALITILAIILVVSDCYLVPTAAFGFDGRHARQNGLRELEIAKYAVNEHNKYAHTNLVFESLIEAESQAVVGGSNFRLVIKVQVASVDGYPHVYEALVYQGWNGQQDLHLRHFKQLRANSYKYRFN